MITREQVKRALARAIDAGVDSPELTVSDVRVLTEMLNALNQTSRKIVIDHRMRVERRRS